MRSLDLIGRALDGQRGHLLPWVPVCLGAGIGIYFTLPIEPARAEVTVVCLLSAVALILMRQVPQTLAPLALAAALVGAGFGLAAFRAHSVAAPVLEYRYYGPIEGRIVQLDRSSSDRPRLTLDQVVLAHTSPARTPGKVRVSLHGDASPATLEPGLRVILTGHLSPPPCPSEPGGFDFRRLAWFERLGAVGYTRNPVLALEAPARPGPAVRLYALRMKLAGVVKDHLDGQTGAFAAAVTTADRSALSQQTLNAMRDTNLAHLLAISGLHVGLLSGVVFTAVRAGLALVPRLALRVNSKKIGAVAAMAAAAAYLALSGAPVSTQRAFIMVTVMLWAVLVDQRALTLRAVAISATVILILQPESLLSAGFQMSFAATTALVWVFSGLRDDRIPRLPDWGRPIAAVLLSSAVAGFATAPFGAAHFNRSASYGLIANLLSVPAMGSIVVPAAVAALCLAPFGLHGWALWLMGLGIDWILGVASWLAALDGAVRHIARPPAAVLPVIVCAALFVVLWQGRLRWAGILPICLAMAGWHWAERPAILIAESGGLIGVMTAEGRALNKPRGDGYTAISWLENDGDGADQALAAARTGTADTELKVQQRMAVEMRATTSCNPGTILVTTLTDPPDPGCPVLTPDHLGATGAVAIDLRDQRRDIRTVTDLAGLRLWTTADVRRWITAGGERPTGINRAEQIERILDAPPAKLAGTLQ